MNATKKQQSKEKSLSNSNSIKNQPASTYFFWVDLEMTGLNSQQDHVLEIACIITNTQLEPLAQFHEVIFQPHENLKTMDPWVHQTHLQSGLLKAVPNGTPLDKVEEALIQWLNPYFKEDEKIVLSGNSVHKDREFIDANFKKLSQKLHYRIIDISSFKEVFRTCYHLQFEKANKHEALADILESICELKFYLSAIDPHRIEKLLSQSK